VRPTRVRGVVSIDSWSAPKFSILLNIVIENMKMLQNLLDSLLPLV
jgi:hypothetical protein